MGLKPGYKQTEVGVIPEEWEVMPLQSLAHIERGKFTARREMVQSTTGGKSLFIQTGDVNNSGWSHHNVFTDSESRRPKG